MNLPICDDVRLRRGHSSRGWLGILAVLTLAGGLLVYNASGYIGRSMGPGQADYEFSMIGDYQLVRTSSLARFVTTRGGTSGVVPDDIRELGWDDRFIVCHQYRSSATGVLASQKDQLGWYWWIVDARESVVYGPLSDHEFGEKIRELPVDASLELHDTSRYGRGGVYPAPGTGRLVGRGER